MKKKPSRYYHALSSLKFSGKYILSFLGNLTTIRGKKNNKKKGKTLQPQYGLPLEVEDLNKTNPCLDENDIENDIRRSDESTLASAF